MDLGYGDRSCVWGISAKLRGIMQTVPVPLFANVYRNVDGEELSDRNYELIDGYVDELGYSVKRPGLSLLLDLGYGTNLPVEGLFWWPHKQVVIAVCNNKVLKLSYTSGTLSATDITTNGPGTAATPTFGIGTNANVATPTIYGVVAAGATMTTGNGTGTTISNFATMADADAPTTVTHVDFIDGYLLATTGTGVFQYADVNAPTTWSAGSYANAMRNPDVIKALKVFQRQIFLFGQVSTEIWENDGTTPFAPIPGGFVDVGIVAPYSIVTNGDTMYWLDDNRHFVSYSKGVLQRVSTPYDYEIEGFSAVADCIGARIEIRGRPFCLFQFPTEARTLAFNVAENSWSEWRRWDTTYGEYQHFEAKSYCYSPDWGLHLVGSRRDSKIYALSPDYKSDNGDPIRFKKVTGHIDYGTTKRKRSNELRIRCKRGEGVSGGGQAVMMLRWKDDNRQWSNEHQVSLGSIGETETVVRLFPRGVYRTRQYEVTVTDNVGFTFGSAEEDIDVLG